MDSLTITITESSNGGYVYQVWPHDLDASALLSEEGSTEGDDNGGLCTGTLLNALGMAVQSAKELIGKESREVHNKHIHKFMPQMGDLDEKGEPIEMCVKDDCYAILVS